MYNFSQQDYDNFLHNQSLSETASPCILGGRVNETDMLNTNIIFTPPSTPVNLEEDHLNKFLMKPLKTGFSEKISHF